MISYKIGGNFSVEFLSRYLKKEIGEVISSDYNQFTNDLFDRKVEIENYILYFDYEILYYQIGSDKIIDFLKILLSIFCNVY